MFASCESFSFRIIHMDRISPTSDAVMTAATATTPDGAAATGPSTPREIDSVTLMGGQRELFIRHAQDIYRLRVTAQGKLILTK